MPNGHRQRQHGPVQRQAPGARRVEPRLREIGPRDEGVHQCVHQYPVPRVHPHGEAVHVPAQAVGLLQYILVE
eukprot:3932455-Rhodomonas_salina.1